MSKILSKIFNFLKYILLIAAFGIIFLGVTLMYKRLEKPITDAISIFVPFTLVLIIFIISLFTKKKETSENLLFNFGCVLILLVIIIIGVRAKFDKNMVIYYKYGIEFNSAFLADNIAMIQSMLYVIFISNLLLIIGGTSKNKKQKVVDNVNESKIESHDEVEIKPVDEKINIASPIITEDSSSKELDDIESL